MCYICRSEERLIERSAVNTDQCYIFSLVDLFNTVLRFSTQNRQLIYENK